MNAYCRKKLKERFDMKTGPVDLHWGNRISVDSDMFNASIDQTAYIDDLLAKFGLNDSKPAATPMDPWFKDCLTWNEDSLCRRLIMRRID